LNQNSGLKSGIVISFISKYTNVIISLIITCILARILTPNDYGIVAVVMVFITFFSILGDMGIGAAVIQKKDLTKRDVSDLFKLTLMLSVVFALIFFLLAGAIALFYRNGVYIKIARLMAAVVFFSTLNMVPYSLLLKNKKFAIVGVTNILSSLIGGVAAVIMAFHGAKYYSIVFQSIISSALLFFFNFLLSRIRIYKGVRFGVVKKIFSYSAYQFIFNVINYFARNLDNILIGRSMGSQSLGYYNQAYKLMMYPLQYLTYVINPVLHPVLSNYQTDKKTMFREYMKISKLLAAIGFFISCACFVCSREIIMILYGSQWVQSIPIFKILSLSIGLQVILSSTGSIFLASGNSKYLCFSGSAAAFFVVLGIIIGIYSGNLNIVAEGIVCGYVINFFISFITLIKYVLNCSFKLFVKNIYVFIGAALLIIILSVVIKISISNIFIAFVVKGLLCSAIYLMILILTGEAKALLRILKPKRKVFPQY
jgi:O-antigen/teichoic acid export membrane protein